MALQAASKRAIQNAVDNLISFSRGNLYSGWFNSWSDVPKGKLPLEYHNPSFREGLPVYVVLSYETPIAWTFRVHEATIAWTFSVDAQHGAWTIPDIRYSQTTTNHQAIVRTAIENPGFFNNTMW
jgi:hypothetical protein